MPSFGKIGLEDFYGGQTTEYNMSSFSRQSRVNPSSNVTLKRPFPYIDSRLFSTLEEAVTAVSSIETTLWVSSVLPSTTNVVIPSSLDIVFLNGGGFSPSAGTTVSFTNNYLTLGGFNPNQGAGNFSGGVSATVTSGPAGARFASKVIAAKDSIDKTRADYVCDGSTDNVTFQSAMNAVGTSGGKILCLEGNYIFASTVFGKSHVILQGTGHQPYWGEATTLWLNHSGPMFAYSGASMGFGFMELSFQGKNQRFPAIDCFSETGGSDNKGCFNVRIERCTFDSFAPAIKARNAWDWWVEGCGFNDCGDMSATSSWSKSQIYVKSTDIGGGQGAFSNHWNIMNNRANTSKSVFFYSDDNNGFTNPNAFMMFQNNATEGGSASGFSSVRGVLAHSRFIGNYFGMTVNAPLIDLSGDTGRGFGNIFIGNEFREVSGDYAVKISDYYDSFVGNHFYSMTSGAISILVGGYRNQVAFNTFTTDTSPINNSGTESTIAFNQGLAQGVYLSAPTGTSSHIPIVHGGATIRLQGMT